MFVKRNTTTTLNVLTVPRLPLMAAPCNVMALQVVADRTPMVARARAETQLEIQAMETRTHLVVPPEAQ